MEQKMNSSDTKLYGNDSNKDSSFPAIPGVDVKKGISRTGGKEDVYRRVLITLCQNIEERLPLLKTPPELDTLSKFVVNVHAFNGSTASIGAAEVSDRAAKLETAGRAGDLAYIREHLSDFLEHLTTLMKNIGAALNTSKENEQGLPVDKNLEIDVSTVRLFRELAESLKSQKVPEVKRLQKLLNQQAANSNVKKALDKISDQILMAEFDNAVKTAEELVASSGKK